MARPTTEIDAGTPAQPAGGRVDLHVHSTASDGQHPPADVVRRAAAAGLAVIALTDHDTLAGVPDARSAAPALGMRVVAGCEFSARAEWGEVHVLGYFLPPDEPELTASLAGWRAMRRRRAERIVRLLVQLGVPLTLEDVETEAGGRAALGRPHVARALARKGLVRDPQEAFDVWLATGRPAYVEKELPSIPDVTALIHRVGGVAVIAHLGERGTPENVQALRQQGMDGVEVRHPSHDASTERRLTALAARWSLAVTGGSDWHGDAGARKHYVPLGEVTVPADWLARLEERRFRASPAG